MTFIVTLVYVTRLSKQNFEVCASRELVRPFQVEPAPFHLEVDLVDDRISVGTLC